MATLPTYYISHGGGPWPYMPEFRQGAMHKLDLSLQDIPRQIGVKPKAVLIISGHWEEPEFTLMSGAQPPMLYDYYGFPEHTYHVKYSAPGAPQLAHDIAQLITDNGLIAQLDDQRGFDHGVFAPLAAIYPNAEIPVVQLSLKAGLDPAQHIAVGRALAPLRDDGVLILGSGSSYHNMHRMGPQAMPETEIFDNWLQQTLVNSEPAARLEKLLDWRHAPAGLAAHPREEHLLPLMVAVGAAIDEPGSCIYREAGVFGGVIISSFRFGAAA
ncbi:MAG: dioxygenase [Verrucomicrobiaceae bacterium]|nr:dioxygenase [Verrucomicrobiaceae bacterium]